MSQQTRPPQAPPQTSPTVTPPVTPTGVQEACTTFCRNAFLTVQNLHVRTAAKELVSNVSFSAAKGRVLGLVGESGSGKSLTCLAALGLLPKGLSSQGSVTIDGTAITGATPMHRIRGRRIAMILQNPMSCFDPVFTIRTHFRETLTAHGMGRDIPDARLESVLTEVGFPEPRGVLDLYPFQMSGGMLQRVMIALALVLEAPFLIADEPTTDLDTVAQAKVLDLLACLKERCSMGMLLVTHDLGVIARLADDVAVMRHGVIVEQASVTDLFSAPRHPYTQELIGTHLRLAGLDFALQGRN